MLHRRHYPESTRSQTCPDSISMLSCSLLRR
jgi:hypothetical protein